MRDGLDNGRVAAITRCALWRATANEIARMTELLPDRLSIDPDSPHYDEALLSRGIGIRFNGAEKTNVEEYCISEGWVRVSAGKAVDRKGKPLTLKLRGMVEAYLRGDAPAA